jgi:hypothetical protein
MIFGTIWFCFHYGACVAVATGVVLYLWKKEVRQYDGKHEEREKEMR